MSIKNNISSLQEVLNTINTLPEAGTDLPELTNEGSASDLLSGKQLIDGDGNIVTGNIPTKTSSNLTASGATVTVPAGYYVSQATKSVTTATQATPSVSISPSGLITASATQTEGYVSAGTKSGTKQLTTQGMKTITPSTNSQTAVGAGVYVTAPITVAAIPSQYVDNSTVDAVESDVMSGKKFGANGSVKTGTFTIDSELSTQDDLIAQIQAAVDSLPEAGGAEPTLQNKTVTPTTSSQTVSADSGYDGLNTVTVNAMPTATQATPSISVSTSGLITASATQTAGYVSSGTKSATKQLTTQAAKTITPSTSSQTAVASGVYTTGAVTVNGDSNLVASNIKSGVSIFGVTGSYGGSGSGSGEPGSDGSSGEPGSGSGTTGSGSGVPQVGVSGFVQSTAEGSVIYAYDSSSGIQTGVNDLTYLSQAKRYRHALAQTLIANTPIVVLTTGTITMPSASGYTPTLITSGSGYAVYKYTN